MKRAAGAEGFRAEAEPTARQPIPRAVRLLIGVWITQQRVGVGAQMVVAGPRVPARQHRKPTVSLGSETCTQVDAEQGAVEPRETRRAAHELLATETHQRAILTISDDRGLHVAIDRLLVRRAGRPKTRPGRKLEIDAVFAPAGVQIFGAQKHVLRQRQGRARFNQRPLGTR